MDAEPGPRAVPSSSQNVFTSGVPSSGDERLRLNLYVFRRSAHALEKGTEVVVETFEYVP